MSVDNVLENCRTPIISVAESIYDAGCKVNKKKKKLPNFSNYRLFLALNLSIIPTNRKEIEK